MKRILTFILIICLTGSLTACGQQETIADTAASTVETVPTETTIPETTLVAETDAPIETETETSEEDMIDDEAWDTLAALGSVKTESGLLTVSITLPQEYVGEDTTQESLNENAPEKYLSAKLNDDGSATFVLTKRQHKELMTSTAESMDQALQELIDSEDYQIREITRNDDFSHFDVYLDTEELGFAESFTVLIFYLYGEMYGCFVGQTPEHITVNFYDNSGNLINTSDSADMGE